MKTDLKNIFYGIPKRKGMVLYCDTHYDANNYVFEKWEGNKLHRLDFQPLQNEIIKVTHHIDSFGCCSKLLIWCHNYLPNFPYLAKIEYNNVCDIDIHDEKLKAKILEIVNKTFKMT